MDYSFRSRARKSLEELERDVAEKILEKIEEMAEEGFKHRNVKLFRTGTENGFTG